MINIDPRNKKAVTRNVLDAERLSLSLFLGSKKIKLKDDQSLKNNDFILTQLFFVFIINESQIYIADITLCEHEWIPNNQRQVGG